jgi:hypothetical protein
MSTRGKSLEVAKNERASRWLEENREGFEAFARFVERSEIFNEEDRDWWPHEPEDTLQGAPPRNGFEK